MLSRDRDPAALRVPRLPGWFSFYRLIARPILFLLNAESAHDLTMSWVHFISNSSLLTRLVGRRYRARMTPLQTNLAGLVLPSPIGLAAGFDKNAVAVPFFEQLGFGFVEVGTVTPRPQIGNPRPRLIRIPEKRALVNRMGFNNDGVDAVKWNLEQIKHRVKIPIGVNIGKNRDTPNSEALKDYSTLFEQFRDLANYFVINISSPNTPGLRDLQSGSFVTTMSERVSEIRAASGSLPPVFVKLAPDLDHGELKAICSLCGPGKSFAGLVLSNTIPTDLGGMSGFPLRPHSVALLKAARESLPAEAPVISVGGIETAEDVFERLSLGANAVQIYSTFVYRGPSAAIRLLHDLQKLLRKRGIRNLSEIRTR